MIDCSSSLSLEEEDDFLLLAREYDIITLGYITNRPLIGFDFILIEVLDCLVSSSSLSLSLDELEEDSLVSPTK